MHIVGRNGYIGYTLNTKIYESIIKKTSCWASIEGFENVSLDIIYKFVYIKTEQKTVTTYNYKADDCGSL